MKIELGFKKGEFIYKNNKTPPAEKDWLGERYGKKRRKLLKIQRNSIAK
jgi:hypothetical protein